MKVNVAWKEKVQFEGRNEHNNIVIPMDSPDAVFGGENKGPTPKELFLQSIAGCSSIDVISILSKMKASMPESFVVDVDGEVPEEHPKVFVSISLIYNVKGATEKDKLIKAVTLSQEKYCGLSIMMKKITAFSFKVILNGEEIMSGV